MTAPFRHTGILLLTALSAVFQTACYKELPAEEPEVWDVSGRVLKFDGIYAFADMEDKLLLYPLPFDTVSSFSPLVGFGSYEAVEFNGVELRENEVNDLGDVMLNHPYPVIAQKGKDRDVYQLYFTNLPLLQIHTDIKIPDEPKVLSWLELAFTEMEGDQRIIKSYSSHAGIEIRGRTSAVYEKKSYGLELWENLYGNDKKASLLGMRNGEDWILDAMYIDHLRMRNKLSFDTWALMWENSEQAPFRTNRPGIACEYIELFINQRYMGLYTLGEKLDESLMNITAGKEGSEGVLYKAFDWHEGGTAFKTYNLEPGNSTIWEGWEQLYPDHCLCWSPLSELRKSVVFDRDELFSERIDTLLNLEAAATYYLFTNLILAHDNLIKNYFLARYPYETRFLILPWDLEGSWGIMWDGEKSQSSGVLENGLFKRLTELDVNEFNDLLEDRWEQYRESIFRLDSLLLPAHTYAGLLKRSGAIDRENNRWTGTDIDLDMELIYLSHWLELRLEYLDQLFD